MVKTSILLFPAFLESNTRNNMEIIEARGVIKRFYFVNQQHERAVQVSREIPRNFVDRNVNSPSS